VFDEGLNTAGAVSTGNIGIIGTAEKGPVNEVVILSSFSEARAYFGEAGDWISDSTANLSLVRSLELIFNNGGGTVYAARIATSAAAAAKLEIKSGTTKLLTLEAASKGTSGNNLSVQIIETGDGKQLIITGAFDVEKYSISTVKAVADLINAKSRLVKANFEKEGDLAVLNAVKLAGGLNGEAVTSAEIKKGLELLESDIINIVLVAGAGVSSAEYLTGHLNKTSENKRERIALIGAEGEVSSNNLDSERLILVAPGIKTRTYISSIQKEVVVDLPASYTAAAIAGLISSLPVQASPTNKVLAVGGLSNIYNTGSLEKLIQNRVLAVEKREGYRIVKGITTSTNSAWHQITTRRIVDYAIYGVRSACNPYIGKLNNERVRNAMKATLDAFLTRMTNDEALISYELEVTATRAEQIAGVVQVTMVLRPTFSIDFIKVNMYLG
jgi:hypothetical protein